MAMERELRTPEREGAVRSEEKTRGDMNANGRTKPWTAHAWMLIYKHQQRSHCLMTRATWKGANPGHAHAADWCTQCP